MTGGGSLGPEDAGVGAVAQGRRSGARTAVGVIAGANLVLASGISAAAALLGFIGLMFFDDPNASVLKYLVEIALLIGLPPLVTLACRSWGRRLADDGRGLAAIATALTPSPFLVYILLQAVLVVVHNHTHRG